MIVSDIWYVDCEILLVLVNYSVPINWSNTFTGDEANVPIEDNLCHSHGSKRCFNNWCNKHMLQDKCNSQRQLHTLANPTSSSKIACN